MKYFVARFLSYMAVQRSKLQLVGAACMFIAAKYEEIYPPDVGEFVYITDDTYNKRQVIQMLASIHCRVTCFLSYNFPYLVLEHCLYNI